MLEYAVAFLLLALIAAVLGFMFLVGTVANIAKISLCLFLIFSLLALVSNEGRRRYKLINIERCAILRLRIIF